MFTFSTLRKTIAARIIIPALTKTEATIHIILRRCLVRRSFPSSCPFVEPDYLLGNILKTPLAELVTSDKQKKFGQNKWDSLPQFCRKCDILFACNGECPKNRFVKTPDGEEGLNYLCKGFKAFFKHSDRTMKLMAGLLRRGRMAEEVMKILKTEGDV
ncbi:MAG: SPASM domain-containing protein [Candidatus Eremiobacterota bacterium]